MAIASSASPVCYILLAAQNQKTIFCSTTPINQNSFPTSYFRARKQQLQRRRTRLQIIIRSSTADEISSTTAIEAESETPVELPKGPPSIISTLNVEKALRGIVAAITDADHYGRLGLSSGCSYDQVNIAYKNKVTEVVTNKAGLDEEQVNKELELLKESHSILSTVEERRLYDWSLARAGKPDRYMWPSQVDITQTQSPGTPPPQEPEDERPTRLVGYFFLTWLIVSFVLFIAFNR